MKDIIIRAFDRPKEDKIWLRNETCFDHRFLGENITNILNTSVSLSEICIKPNMGFVPHKHENIDFIIIPLKGKLCQRSSNGDVSMVNAKEMHYMQTGIGISHFEYNLSMTDDLVCLVFKINPSRLNKDPVCETVRFSSKKDTLNKVLSGPLKNKLQNPIKDVLVSYGQFDTKKLISYKLKKMMNGVLVYVVKGIVTINDKMLSSKDTILIWKTTSFIIVPEQNSELILFEFPMILK